MKRFRVKEGMLMGVTMKEIAYMCGVSRGTVDRVLNNRGKVRPETEEHIRAVAKSMGYRSIQSMVVETYTGKAMKIGLLVNSMDQPYFAQILESMTRSIEELEPYKITSVIKYSGGFDVDQQLRLLDELLVQEVDALAMTSANSPRIADKLREFSAKGIPVVLISSLLDNYEPFAFVGCNHVQSGRIAAGFAHQITPPGSKIAVVSGSTKMTGLKLRCDGFIQALQRGGREDEVLEPVYSQDDDMIAFKVASGLISRHPDIDLIFLAAGGYKGVYEALTDAGAIGRVKIIAFDMLEINQQYLKSGAVSALFDQHPGEQGRTAIRILSDYLLKKKIPERKNCYLPIEIVLAESLDERLTDK